MSVVKLKHKPLSVYAVDITLDWENPSNTAVPYIRAMATLDQIEDYYLLDSATEIVSRFLANAQSWRGDTARKIKAELKRIVKNCDLEKSAETGRKIYGIGSEL